MISYSRHSGSTWVPSQRECRSAITLWLGTWQPDWVAQWPDAGEYSLPPGCLCLQHRQDSGLRNLLLESWAGSFQAADLHVCWNLENRAGGHECGACKCGGILVGGLCSSLCHVSPEFSPNSFFPFHLSLFLLPTNLWPQQKGLMLHLVNHQRWQPLCPLLCLAPRSMWSPLIL